MPANLARIDEARSELEAFLAAKDSATSQWGTWASRTRSPKSETSEPIAHSTARTAELGPHVVAIVGVTCEIALPVAAWKEPNDSSFGSFFCWHVNSTPT